MSYMGGGDIWSTGAFSYESSLKDLLDSGHYTLEQLLAEDDLLLEIRGCHQTLISFISSEESVTKLIQYITKPPRSTSDNYCSNSPKVPSSIESFVDDRLIYMMNGDHPPDRKVSREPGSWLSEHLLESPIKERQDQREWDSTLVDVRFPYIACEIICCEIPSVIETIVNGKVVLDCSLSPVDCSTEVVTSCDSDDVEVITSSEGSSGITAARDGVSGGSDILSTNEMRNPIKDYSNTILDLLFSVLYNTKQGDLDDYRAGYFDKALTVLFRRRPDELTSFINMNGRYRHPYQGSLMHALLKHLYSHSIMQIAQRLLQPQKPTGKISALAGGSDEDGIKQDDDNNDQLIIVGGDEPNEAQVHCNWSNSKEALELLLDILTGSRKHKVRDEEQRLDMSLNASEVLITIIQNSMLSSNIMLSLTQSDTILRIIRAATVLPEGEENFSRHESLLTSAMNVLENLILQLGGYGALGTMSLLQADDDPQNQIDLSNPTGHTHDSVMNDVFKSDSFEHDDEQHHQSMPFNPQDDKHVVTEENHDGYEADIEVNHKLYSKDEMFDNDDDRHLIADLGSILKHLPEMLDNLAKLLSHPSTQTWKSPMQYSDRTDQPEQQLLGSSRLRIIRVLESLVLLGDQDVDDILIQQQDCLTMCLDFFWQFQWCSMLHQSVANLLVHVFEGQNARADMQEFFLYRCDLLGRLMSSFLGPESDETMNTNNYNKYDNNDQFTSPNQEDDPLYPDITMPSSSTALLISEYAMPTQAASIDGMIVENLNDLNEDVKEGNPTGVELLAAALLESGDMSKGSLNVSDPLPVSEDDVDAAMEQTVDQLSTDAIRQELSMGGCRNVISATQTFRCGCMGHVIIICQALVNAYMIDDDVHGQDHQDQQQMNPYQDQTGGSPNQVLSSAPNGFNRSDSGEVGTYSIAKDDLGDPLRLIELVTQHPLADRWHEFVATTLASENAIQATALGGSNMQGAISDVMATLHPPHSIRPGLIDEGYMLGDDGDGPPAPPPRGMLGGGDIIDMDDNDLDIAANMMAGLSLSHPKTNRQLGTIGNRAYQSGNDDATNENDDTGSLGSGSGDSDKSYNSGETANEKCGYAFDDPLGKSGGLGIELGKLSQYNHGPSKSILFHEKSVKKSPKTKEDDEENESDSHSSSSEEDLGENTMNDSEDVPVLDLFAGNFNFTSSDDSADESQQQQRQIEPLEFADFANFDDVPIMSSPVSENPLPSHDNLNTSVNPYGAIVSGDFDDDFGPFACANNNDDKQDSSTFKFGTFESIVVDVEDDPFNMDSTEKTVQFSERSGLEKAVTEKDFEIHSGLRADVSVDDVVTGTKLAEKYDVDDNFQNGESILPKEDESTV